MRAKFAISERDQRFLLKGAERKFEFKKLSVRLGVDDAGRLTYSGVVKGDSFLGIGPSFSVQGAIDLEGLLRQTVVGERLHFYSHGWKEHRDKQIKAAGG